MTILKRTPNQIVIFDCALKYWILGLILSWAGLAIVNRAKLNVLTCSRTPAVPAQCQIDRSSLLGIGSRRELLSRLQAASVHTYTNRSVSYQVVLSTDTGETQLSQVTNSDRAEVEAIAAQINAFINNPTQSSLKVQQDDRLVMFLITSMALIPGGVILFCVCRITRCSLERCSLRPASLKQASSNPQQAEDRQGKLRLEYWGLLGMRAQEYPLSKVTSVEVHTSPVSKSYKTSHIVFWLQAERGLHQVALPSHFTQRKSQEAIAATLSTFLQTCHADVSLGNSSGAKVDETIAPVLSEAETLYRLGMEQYRQNKTQEAIATLKRVRDLFEAQHKTQRVLEIQTLLWQLGLK